VNEKEETATTMLRDNKNQTQQCIARNYAIQGSMSGKVSLLFILCFFFIYLGTDPICYLISYFNIQTYMCVMCVYFVLKILLICKRRITDLAAFIYLNK